MSFNPTAIRSDFPILHQIIGKHPLIYLDNAATTQKPQVVIDALAQYYTEYNANIHRGAHYMANKGTGAYEHTRDLLVGFLHAETREQIVFTKGTTEGINLIASGLAQVWLKPGDEILITAMEHHANIVPWQMACAQSGAVLKVIPILDNGALDLDAARALITEKTKVLSIVYVSNALGTINPVQELVAKAKSVGAVTVVDGAQAVGHFAIDVQQLGCDFFVLSGHKMFGPTGTGVLYGSQSWLEKLPPYQGGGEMIKEVSFEKTTYNELPFKFEAGTPNIGDVIALGAAVSYLNQLDRQAIEKHEHELLAYGTALLSQIDQVQIVGTAPSKAAVISFVVAGTHPSDIGTLLDQYGIAVRTGHHCCQPLMKRFSIPGTIRLSMSFYNTREELEVVANRLQKVINMLQ